MSKKPIFKYILLKLASRCNLDCTYCYWFRDESVYKKPPILTKEAEVAFLIKLESHINQYKLDYFSILFHGGEPLLFSKHRFRNLLLDLQKIEQKTGCKIKCSITTNGVLIDNEWATLFKEFAVSVTISIDGPPQIHDKFRIDLQHKETSSRVIAGLNIIKNHNINPGILSVCNPETDPKLILDYFVNELEITGFDILVPDTTHDNLTNQSIAPYYKRLFDLWYNEYAEKQIDLRYIKGIITGLLGYESKLESIGYGPITTLTMLTDGSLEPLDVLRIAGTDTTKTNLNIQTHTFQDITNEQLWTEAWTASLNLCQKCKACEYKNACGGGFLPHRYSSKNKWDNPSVYCDDLKDIFVHIWNKVSGDITLSNKNGQEITLQKAIETLN